MFRPHTPDRVHLRAALRHIDGHTVLYDRAVGQAIPTNHYGIPRTRRDDRPAQPGELTVTSSDRPLPGTGQHDPAVVTLTVPDGHLHRDRTRRHRWIATAWTITDLTITTACQHCQIPNTAVGLTTRSNHTVNRVDMTAQLTAAYGIPNTTAPVDYRFVEPACIEHAFAADHGQITDLLTLDDLTRRLNLPAHWTTSGQPHD